MYRALPASKVFSQTLRARSRKKRSAVSQARWRSTSGFSAAGSAPCADRPSVQTSLTAPHLAGGGDPAPDRQRLVDAREALLVLEGEHHRDRRADDGGSSVAGTVKEGPLASAPGAASPPPTRRGARWSRRRVQARELAHAGNFLPRCIDRLPMPRSAAGQEELPQQPRRRAPSSNPP